MKLSSREADKILIWILVFLVGVGFFIFMSASLGLLAKEGITLSRIAFNQIVLGLLLGTAALFIASHIHYKAWAKISLWFFIVSCILTLAVHIPGLGFSHGGASRWLSLGPLSLQPAELLKVSFVLFYATILTSLKSKINSWQYVLGWSVGLIILIAGILLSQPDTGTFVVIVGTTLGMLFVAGGKLKHIFLLIGGGLIGLATLVLARDYVRERILTFIDPSRDPLGAGYQIKQSLIAVGSGQVGGRGIGQSIQKFGFLPEPVGDSIFAVFAEEWGFIGSVILLALLFAFFARGFKIASEAPNTFARLIVVGLVLLILIQSLLNIASMIGLFPLTGMPLIFVSQGGTALLIALASVGIILNVSRYMKNS